MTQTKEDQLKLVLESSVLVYVAAQTFCPQRSLSSAQEQGTNFRKLVKFQEVIDPKHLAGFNKLRTAAARACRSRGTYVAVLEGWLVPQADEQALLAELNEIKRQWDEVALGELRSNYDGWVLEQSTRARTQDEAEAVLALAPTLSSVVRATTFAIAVVKLKGDNVALDADQTFDALVERVFAEFAAEIRESRLLDPTFYTPVVRNHIGRMGRKAKALSYLHPRLEEFAQRADQLLGALPDVKRFEGVDADAIRAFLDAVAQPERFLRQGFAARPAQAAAQPVMSPGAPHRPSQRAAPSASLSIEELPVLADVPLAAQASWEW